MKDEEPGIPLYADHEVIMENYLYKEVKGKKLCSRRMKKGCKENDDGDV